MSLLATCPNNSDHDRFSTTAHVAQEWEVDARGNFISCIADCTDTTHPPRAGNTWICLDCDDDPACDETVYASVSD